MKDKKAVDETPVKKNKVRRLIKYSSTGKVVCSSRSKDKNDVSKTYRHNGIVYYKSYPDAEPEILAAYGYHILNYKEFLADIDFQGKQYRVFYNPISNEFSVNEFFDKSKNILINPSINYSALDKMWEVLKDVPEDQKKITVRAFNRKLQEYDSQKKSLKKATKKTKGRPQNITLMKAALWTLSNRKFGESNFQLIKRAYEKHDKNKRNLKSFTGSIKNNWGKIRKEYEEFKKINTEKDISLKIFAKNKLRKLMKLNKSKDLK